jgi:hypothetical protein
MKLAGQVLIQENALIATKYWNGQKVMGPAAIFSQVNALRSS